MLEKHGTKRWRTNGTLCKVCRRQDRGISRRSLGLRKKRLFAGNPAEDLKQRNPRPDECSKNMARKDGGRTAHFAKCAAGKTAASRGVRWACAKNDCSLGIQPRI